MYRKRSTPSRERKTNIRILDYVSLCTAVNSKSITTIHSNERVIKLYNIHSRPVDLYWTDQGVSLKSNYILINWNTPAIYIHLKNTINRGRDIFWNIIFSNDLFFMDEMISIFRKPPVPHLFVEFYKSRVLKKSLTIAHHLQASRSRKYQLYRYANCTFYSRVRSPKTIILVMSSLMTDEDFCPG